MINLQKFKTLLDLLAYFNGEQVCRDYLELVRWEGNLECPYEDCGHDKVFKYNTRKYSESDRFNLMLTNASQHLPYKKLIQNEQSEKPVVRDTEYNWHLEVKQGRLGF